jgi:uncharacterized protein
MQMQQKTLDLIVHILVIVGGVNWGLIGFFDYNLVGELFGWGTGITRIIYGLVGVAAVYMALDYFKLMGKTNQVPKK